MSKKSLYPAKTVTVNPVVLIGMIVLFAIIFFLIGVWTMHYPHMEAVI